MQNFRIHTLVIACLLFFAACKHHKTITKTEETEPENKTELTSSFSAIKKEYAAKLAVPEKNIQNEKLYRFIKEWYGSPYKYAGKTKQGIDCSGFSNVLYLNVYKKQLSASSKNQHDDCKKINIKDAEEGDLVFFNTSGKGVSHVGVYLQNNKFVHASTTKGVMISDLNEPYFKKNYISCGKVK